jgi:tetrahydromethanopterin S-methyltransferase subunit G
MSTDIDIDHRLEDIEEKIEQNSKVLRSIKRKLTFDFWFGIIKIGIFVGAFYSFYSI